MVFDWASYCIRRLMEQPSGIECPNEFILAGCEVPDVPRGVVETPGGIQQVLLTLCGATFANP